MKSVKTLSAIKLLVIQSGVVLTWIFFPNDLLIDQLPLPVVYTRETRGAIKNLYVDGKLIFACNGDNESWGNLFVEYHCNKQKSLFFVENDSEKMELRRLRLVYTKGGLYDTIISYTCNSDEDEESLIVDTFIYKDCDLFQITRSGFWGDRTRILPIKEYIVAPSDVILDWHVTLGRMLQTPLSH